MSLIIKEYEPFSLHMFISSQEDCCANKSILGLVSNPCILRIVIGLSSSTQGFYFVIFLFKSLSFSVDINSVKGEPAQPCRCRTPTVWTHFTCSVSSYVPQCDFIVVLDIQLMLLKCCSFYLSANLNLWNTWGESHSVSSSWNILKPVVASTEHPLLWLLEFSWPGCYLIAFCFLIILYVFHLSVLVIHC